MTIRRLIADNIATLEQGASLVAQLAGAPLEFSQRLGPHLRHVLDHYDCFFAGATVGQIDYDARQRDRDCETHLATAGQRITRAIARLRALPVDELPPRLQVRLATSADADGLPSWSSPGRELQFLQSHAVHHYALIRLHCEHAGFMLDPGFGKAPSTLRHERETACQA